MDRPSTDIEVIDNLFDGYFGHYIISKIKENGRWSFATDHEHNNKELDKCDNGFLLTSYTDDETETNQKEFNVLADYILHIFLEHSKWQYNQVTVKRFFYNYYNRESQGSPHIDHPQPNHHSILVNLNTNDGGTIVDDEFFPSEVGRCIGFDSDTTHQGVGPTKHKQRYCLNIVFAYNNRSLKT